MDKSGLIYDAEAERRLLEAEIERQKTPPPPGLTHHDVSEELRQIELDQARLDGYLRARVEADAPKRGPGANKDLAG